MRNAAPVKIGRNDPCPCGSGRKYKHCCFAQDKARGANARAEEMAVQSALQRATQFHQAGRLHEAEAVYHQVLQLRPGLGWAHYNLGNVLREQGRLDEAAGSYRSCLAHQPDSVEAYSNLGSVLRAADKLEEAIAIYRSGLVVRPDAAPLHFNLGNALYERGSLAEAIDCYRQALAIDPGLLEVYTNLGLALVERGEVNEGIVWYRKALAIDPDLQEIHTNLGAALAELESAEDALASYRKARALKPDDPGPYSCELFLTAYQSLLPPREYLAVARGWEQAVVPAQERAAARRRRFARADPAHRRLRVGYVSGDFRQHAASYFLEQLFARHDRARIELFAYSTAARRDAVNRRFEGLADHWLPVAGLSDSALRDRIESDRVDVLVDLSGHTAHNRLGVFARRAAPVQAHYLGFFASTGLTEMDYWIGDGILVPAGADSHFSETPWRLARTWVSYEGRAEAPAPNWRPAAEGTVWLGSFNDLKKLTPATLALWAGVLHALPQGKLLLKTRMLADQGNRRRVLDALTAQGIAPDRIELQDSGITPGWGAHMAYYDRLDIALDPVAAVGGGTTSCDALWMGVPLVTLAGDSVASRMTASMLTAIGHPEWIAASEAAYVAAVVALARDVEYRKSLRGAQRGKMALSPLCDGADLALQLENAYVEMFRRWLDGANGRNAAAP